MLKYRKVELELLTDPNMLLFIRKGIRGGISQCSNHYAKANNPYMEDYNPEEETKYLIYYGVNNLYGWAMSQALPYRSFKWVSSGEFDSVNIFNVPDDSENGYILEVTLEYPESLHDGDSDLPMCPEHRAAPGT